MGLKKSKWYMTGESRIVPSWFGFMRAELLWRRDLSNLEGEVVMYELKWKSAGSLPLEYDNNGPFGFWSTLATPHDWRFGLRSIYVQFVTYFSKPEHFDDSKTATNVIDKERDDKQDAT